MATSSIGKIVYLDDDSADRIIAAQKNKYVTIGGRVDKVKMADEADIKRILALVNSDQTR